MFDVALAHRSDSRSQYCFTAGVGVGCGFGVGWGFGGTWLNRTVVDGRLVNDQRQLKAKPSDVSQAEISVSWD